MSDKQFVQKKVRDLMAWFKTKDQSFVEDHLRNLVSNKAKKQYQEISQLIISEFELMLATAESKYQFYVSFLHVIYDQDLFDSKVQSIVEYAQIKDAKINQSTCEVSGVSEFSTVCSEHEVPMKDELLIQTPIVVQSIQLEGEQLSLELEQPSDVSKDYSSKETFKWYLFNCSAGTSFNGIERHAFSVHCSNQQHSYLSFSQRKDEGKQYE